MKKQNQQATSKAERGGDTSRTSSQGRKAASGGNPDKSGNPEMDDNTKNPVSGSGKARKIGEKRKRQ